VVALGELDVLRREQALVCAGNRVLTVTFCAVSENGLRPRTEQRRRPDEETDRYGNKPRGRSVAHTHCVLCRRSVGLLTLRLPN
jgi:hypothetical protein